MCAILQLVSAPSNPIPIVDHFRRSHPLHYNTLITARGNVTEVAGQIDGNATHFSIFSLAPPPFPLP